MLDDSLVNRLCVRTKRVLIWLFLECRVTILEGLISSRLKGRKSFRKIFNQSNFIWYDVSTLSPGCVDHVDPFFIRVLAPQYVVRIKDMRITITVKTDHLAPSFSCERWSTWTVPHQVNVLVDLFRALSPWDQGSGWLHKSWCSISWKVIHFKLCA